jgi:hypothetical protein
MSTGFVALGGSDLTALLAPRGSLAAISNVGFVSGALDLAQLFAGASFGTAYSTIANTDMVSGGVDIATLFAAIGTLFSPTTTTFTTGGAHSITIPTKCSSMTLEIEGGGGGGGGNAGTNPGNGGSSGARCVSTYAISPTNWGQTLTLTCGVSQASTGVNNVNGQGGNPSTVVAGTFTGFTTMTANGGDGGIANLGGAGAAGTATGGNVTNQTGNTNTTQQAGATGLTGTFINGLNGAGGSFVTGIPRPDTATTLGQGAVHFS